jgi:hypothetical protein
MNSKYEKQSAAEFAERVRVNSWDRLVANSILPNGLFSHPTWPGTDMSTTTASLPVRMAVLIQTTR